MQSWKVIFADRFLLTSALQALLVLRYAIILESLLMLEKTLLLFIYIHIYLLCTSLFQYMNKLDLPGSSVVGSLSANAEDTDSIPHPVKIHALGKPSLCTANT